MIDSPINAATRAADWSRPRRPPVGCTLPAPGDNQPRALTALRGSFLNRGFQEHVMAKYQEPGFADRAAASRNARAKAVAKLQAKPALDQAELAERAARAKEREAALEEKRKAALAKREAEREARLAKKQERAAAEAKAEAKAQLSEEERKAARDAKYAARKARKK
ncbi:DUF6481 family protein [Croceicoccus sp. BE223]|uniref:DUF6481 family protein n=1 Tax=Croceicoccus sp. BE223 TaxID=2817716 RepID=UPI0028609975|nr:DUF6481 family protein [Croceicoccus sp. BE223]MDR7102414.1 hypothetical protein [Croceicoccus sp. BE223]